MYNWSHALLNIFSAEDSRYNDYVKGFGNIWEGFFVANNAQTIAGLNNLNVTTVIYLKKDTRRCIPDRSMQTIERYVNERNYISNQAYANHY